MINNSDKLKIIFKMCFSLTFVFRLSGIAQTDYIRFRLALEHAKNKIEEKNNFTTNMVTQLLK